MFAPVSLAWTVVVQVLGIIPHGRHGSMYPVWPIR